MGMRLLARKDVDAAKALDRQREVDEGVKLAKKVDTLRELQAQEEASLLKFRDNSLTEIVGDINLKIAQRDDLEARIIQKKEELLKLSGPLDRAWLFYVDSEKAAIAQLRAASEQKLGDAERKLREGDSFIEGSRKSYETKLQELWENRSKWQESVRAEMAYIETAKSELDNANKEIELLKANQLKLLEENDLEKRRLELKRQEQSDNTENARLLFESAKKAVLEAEEKTKKLLADAKQIERQATERNTEAAIRESNVQLQEENLAKKEDELETREMNALSKELLYFSPVKKN